MFLLRQDSCIGLAPSPWSCLTSMYCTYNWRITVFWFNCDIQFCVPYQCPRTIVILNLIITLNIIDWLEKHCLIYYLAKIVEFCQKMITAKTRLSVSKPKACKNKQMFKDSSLSVTHKCGRVFLLICVVSLDRP